MNRRGSRRYVVMGVAAVLLVVAAVAGWMMVATSSPQRVGADHASFKMVTVERRDLTVGTSLQGRLGFGDERPIPIRSSGTVTWLPAAGARAALGDTLLKVDNRPVVLMYGSTPAFRAMDDGSLAADVAAGSAPPEQVGGSGEGDAGNGASGADGSQQQTPGRTTRSPSIGPDVEQLERGLSALGYTGFTVDDAFTPGTAAAVRQWQQHLGVPPTGRVELGDVVFLPGPIRVHPTADSLGQPVTDTSVSQTGTTKIVTVETGEFEWAEKGVEARVTLPNQRVVIGRVQAVTSENADSETGRSGTRQIQITLDRPLPEVGPGPVTVNYVSAERKDVLVVPVTALVALAEGGYAVELEDGRPVRVEPGLYAEGLVEVTGDVDVGTRIRVPR